MDISIIILNYKSKGLALNCIKSIKEADFKTSPQPSPLQGEGALKYEIIVVDNNSGDSIGKILNWQYPDVKFIKNSKNLGMGAGNNVGIRRANGKYIVVMNPDTLAFKDTFVKLYDLMENNPEVGVAGPLQYNPRFDSASVSAQQSEKARRADKTIQNSCYRWYGLFTPFYRRTPFGRFKFAKKDIDRYLMRDFDHKSMRKVDWLLGSFLFCRAKALEQVGLFDERFFLYFEDTDLCRRFWQKNWKVVYYPDAKIIHNHVRQSAQDPWYKFLFNKATRYHIVSWVKYLRKWGMG